MKKYFDSIHSVFSTNAFKKGLKIVKCFFIGVLSLLLIGAISLSIYFETNKKKLVAEINTQLNNNILGEAKIGDIGYRFFVGFPNLTLVLKNVELRDTLFAVHKRPLLKAREIETRVNVLMLLKNEVYIYKIVIIDATIDLYKDPNGISNSNIFKPKKKKNQDETTTSINEVVLKNVNFISENKQGNKLFSFHIKSLKSKIDYSDTGWKTDLQLSAFAKSMAFNTQKGSFIKDKKLRGKLALSFSKEKKSISVITNNLEIGGDVFKINSNFNVAKGNSLFTINIKTNIKWSNAYRLLTNNVKSKLDKFDLKKPLLTTCTIKGDMSKKGDPEIVVHAVILENTLTTSYGIVENCSFNGEYTNNYQKGLGVNDINSAVTITDFKGEFKKIPFSIPSAIINNLKKPVATGKLNSDYDVINLENFIKPNYIKFIEGKAKVNLDFKVDIINLRLNKPVFTGNIIFKDASFYYKPKNINFQKTDIDLHFTEEDLLIKKIKFQAKSNTFFMEGKVDNFLSLYYIHPEKMVVNCKIYSPFLDIKQIMSFLTYRDESIPVKKTSKKKPSLDLDEILNKSQVNLDLKVAKIKFNSIIGKNFKLNIQAEKKGVFVNNGSVYSLKGGFFKFDGQLVPHKHLLNFKLNLSLKNGDISNFLSSFNNFGIKSFQPKDINGRVFLKTYLTGTLNTNRELIMNSINGTLNFDIKNGAFNDFQPLIKIGRVVFYNRDLAHVTFSDLYGITTITDGMVNIKDLKVNSNVLNLDVNGIYSLSDVGTNLAVKIPLRNPKDDHTITDKTKRDALRYKGIVVNLMVIDGGNRDTEIKLGKPKGASKEK